ncbi:MAG: hypothetical protein ACK4YM_02390, partial [Novosphingobium sp.]
MLCGGLLFRRGEGWLAQAKGNQGNQSKTHDGSFIIDDQHDAATFIAAAQAGRRRGSRFSASLNCKSGLSAHNPARLSSLELENAMRAIVLPVVASLMAASVALAGTPNFPLPAPWTPHGAEKEAQCGIQTDSYRVMQWGIRGGKDIFGQGYATSHVGFMFVAPRWPRISGQIREDSPRVRITMAQVEGMPAAAKVQAEGRLVQVNETVYF